MRLEAVWHVSEAWQFSGAAICVAFLAIGGLFLWRVFKKRQELVRPIQDKVYTAIEEYAKDRNYDFIFDKSGSAGMIFTNPEYDKTQDILRALSN